MRIEGVELSINDGGRYEAALDVRFDRVAGGLCAGKRADKRADASFGSCAPAPFQYSAALALEMDTTGFCSDYRKKRDIIYDGLKDNFHIVKPGGAFYMFPRLKEGDASLFVEKAIQNKVLIIPGNVFSERNTNFRISFATDNETLHRGIDILNRVAAEYYKQI